LPRIHNKISRQQIREHEKDTTDFKEQKNHLEETNMRVGIIPEDNWLMMLDPNGIDTMLRQ
jgi:hypothetical protein